MAEPSLPVPTPAQTAQGIRLYNRLGMSATSFRTWFAEGTPAEWVQALNHIQQTLTACKREAARAAQAAQAAQAANG
jgi:hypothetical protein